MPYNPEYLARFYDAYDFAEWDRLEVPAYGRLGGHSYRLDQTTPTARGPGGRYRQRPGAILGPGRHARGGADGKRAQCFPLAASLKFWLASVWLGTVLDLRGLNSELPRRLYAACKIR